MSALTPCPYCAVPMRRNNSTTSGDPHRRTHDHILPVEWGGRVSYGKALGVRNVRMCCQRCNSLRAACGHCVGAMACVQDVARHSSTSYRQVMRRWKLGKTARTIMAPAIERDWPALGSAGTGIGRHWDRSIMQLNGIKGMLLSRSGSGCI